MSINKYGNALTVILIILIIAIFIGAGLLLYNYVIKPNIDRKQKIEAIAEFDKEVDQENNNNNNNTGENQGDEDEDVGLNVKPIDSTDNNNGGNNSAVTKSRKTYKGYVMLGYIRIPKTNVKEPILDSVTTQSLNTAVAVLYPNNPQLNEPGNIVIIGHNYKNGQFFSNNKKLSVGDKLYIKDDTGRELEYTIYEKFETTEQDTSFYNRDTDGKAEVTLSTCTDDVKNRIIIFARAD